MRMILILDTKEAEGLVRLADKELRDPIAQLRYILRMELARHGLWPNDPTLSRESGKEGSDD